MNDEARLVHAQIAHRLFTSEDGRRWMEWERVNYGERRSFVEGDEGRIMAFREGQRDTYLEKLEWIAFGKEPARVQLKVVTTEDTPDAA